MKVENTVVDFVKFPSLENTYRQKEIDYVVNGGHSNVGWIVTEKVHGANFSFWMTEVDGVVDIKCAKRTGFIKDDEKFFNYKPVLEKYRDNLIKLFYEMKESYDSTTTVLYGELFGGNIQSGMCYPLEQDFVGFDIKVDSGKGLYPINKVFALNVISDFGIPSIPVMGYAISLDGALEFNEYFTSKLIRDGFDGLEEHKESEGLVIEPVEPLFLNRSRVYFKKKTKRFLEKSGKPNVKHKAHQQKLTVEENAVLEETLCYLTESKFQSVVSKIGEVTIKDIGKVAGLMTKDMLEEVEKDMFTIPEGKTFMRVLQRHVQDFVKPILLTV